LDLDKQDLEKKLHAPLYERIESFLRNKKREENT
jgi:hypothetical protein